MTSGVTLFDLCMVLTEPFVEETLLGETNGIIQDEGSDKESFSFMQMISCCDILTICVLNLDYSALSFKGPCFQVQAFPSAFIRFNFNFKGLFR